MPVQVTTVEIDRGAKRILANRAGLKGAYVKVGVQSGSKKHKESKLDMVKLASVHEFGSRKAKIPERSYIRATMDRTDSELRKESDQRVDAIIAGDETARGLMQKMGLRIQDNIQKAIKESIDLQKLAASTIARRKKKSDKPLWDTGQLLNSIRYISSLGDRG